MDPQPFNPNQMTGCVLTLLTVRLGRAFRVSHQPGCFETDVQKISNQLETRTQPVHFFASIHHINMAAPYQSGQASNQPTYKPVDSEALFREINPHRMDMFKKMRDRSIPYHFFHEPESYPNGYQWPPPPLPSPRLLPPPVRFLPDPPVVPRQPAPEASSQRQTHNEGRPLKRQRSNEPSASVSFPPLIPGIRGHTHAPALESIPEHQTRLSSNDGQPSKRRKSNDNLVGISGLLAASGLQGHVHGPTPHQGPERRAQNPYLEETPANHPGSGPPPFDLLSMPYGPDFHGFMPQMFANSHTRDLQAFQPQQELQSQREFQPQYGVQTQQVNQPHYRPDINLNFHPGGTNNIPAFGQTTSQNLGQTDPSTNDWRPIVVPTFRPTDAHNFGQMTNPGRTPYLIINRAEFPEIDDEIWNDIMQMGLDEYFDLNGAGVLPDPDDVSIEQGQDNAVLTAQAAPSRQGFEGGVQQPEGHQHSPQNGTQPGFYEPPRDPVALGASSTAETRLTQDLSVELPQGLGLSTTVGPSYQLAQGVGTQRPSPRRRKVQPPPGPLPEVEAHPLEHMQDQTDRP